MLLTFLVATTIVSVLEIGLAIPLIRRRVKPNSLYGLRTSDTFADEWVWYEANAASGRDLLKLALVQLAGLFLPLLFWPLNLGYYVVGNLALVGFGTIAMALTGVIRAHSMRRSLERPTSPTNS